MQGQSVQERTEKGFCDRKLKGVMYQVVLASGQLKLGYQSSKICTSISYQFLDPLINAMSYQN